MDKYLEILGRRCQDRVTLATGVAESVCLDLYGCIQVVLRGEVVKAEGEVKHPEGRYYDFHRLEVLDPNPVMRVPDFGTEDRDRGPADKPRRL